MSVKNERLSLVGAAQSLAVPGDQLRQAQWPYPWVYPPPGSVGRSPSTLVTGPANALLTELLSYTVPDGYYYYLRSLLLTYIGVALADADQLVTWNVDVDIPTNPSGVTLPALASGYRIPDYGVVKTHLGSLDEGPWPLDGPIIIDPRATLRVKVTTTAPFTVGAPCLFLTRIVGYLGPANRS